MRGIVPKQKIDKKQAMKLLLLANHAVFHGRPNWISFRTELN
jgi:hypothetical protein